MSDESIVVPDSNQPTPEQVKADAQAEAKVELEKVEALRRENRRLEELNQKKTQDFETKFKSEQEQKARLLAYERLRKFGLELTEEQKIQLDEKKKQLDSGSNDYELQAEDYMKAAAVLFHDKLFSALGDNSRLKQEASEYNKELAGMYGGGVPSEEDNKFSPEAHDLVKRARKEGISLTLSEAQKYLEQGTNRVYR